MKASESQASGASEQSPTALAPALEYLQDLPPIVEPAEDGDRTVPLAKQAGPAAARRHRVPQALLRALGPAARRLATFGALAVASIMALVTWS
jgi:hypothetical protein